MEFIIFEFLFDVELLSFPFCLKFTVQSSSNNWNETRQYRLKIGSTSGSSRYVGSIMYAITVKF